MFKSHIEFDSRIREKLDKKELEDIESISYLFNPLFDYFRENDG